jgi:hypothetical protein
LSSAENITEKTFYDRELRHNRFLDSITEQSLQEFDRYGLDVVVREVPFHRKSRSWQTDVKLPVNRRKEWEEASDLDLGTIDVDNDVIGVYEVKPAYEERSYARQQLEDFADLVEDLNERYGMDWSVTGHPVNADHLNNEYLQPDRYDDGVYGDVESLQKAFRYPDFQILVEHLFRGLEDEEVHMEW